MIPLRADTADSIPADQAQPHASMFPSSSSPTQTLSSEIKIQLTGIPRAEFPVPAEQTLPAIFTHPYPAARQPQDMEYPPAYLTISKSIQNPTQHVGTAQLWDSGASNVAIGRLAVVVWVVLWLGVFVNPS
ncbi:hypothetical protein PVAG01_01789 [Phlyctema vagabunda]|uniref:Uncharacterized protein n=1 Tax=Phlyctema vagabunda TaxID=108571 RepID=A0ABR4PY33_9HELO